MEGTETVAPETAAAPTAPVTTSWRDTLPADIKDAPELAKYTDVAALAKGHVNQAKLVGQKGQIPGPDAKPEDVKAFHRALGVPESPAEYKLKAHEMMAHPEWNRAAQDEFLKTAHALGMTPAQVDGAVQFYANFIGAQVKDNNRLETEAKVELRNEWGVNYDTYMGAANRGISRMEQMLGMQPGTLVEATKGSDPAAIARMFHGIESQFVEHGFVQGEPIQGVSAGDAASKINDLKAQLLKVPEGSEQAKDIINQILAYGRAMKAA